MFKQVTTVLPDDLAEKFDQLCESRGQTPYACLKDLIEFILGDDSKGPEPVGMTAEQALASKPRLNEPSAREKVEAMLRDNWRRYQMGERP